MELPPRVRLIFGSDAVGRFTSSCKPKMAVGKLLQMYGPDFIHVHNGPVSFQKAFELVSPNTVPVIVAAWSSYEVVRPSVFTPSVVFAYV